MSQKQVLPIKITSKAVKQTSTPTQRIPFFSLNHKYPVNWNSIISQRILLPLLTTVFANLICAQQNRIHRITAFLARRKTPAGAFHYNQQHWLQFGSLVHSSASSRSTLISKATAVSCIHMVGHGEALYRNCFSILLSGEKRPPVLSTRFLYATVRPRPAPPMLGGSWAIQMEKNFSGKLLILEAGSGLHPDCGNSAGYVSKLLFDCYPYHGIGIAI